MLYDAAWAYRAAGDDPAPAYAKLLAEFPDLSLAVEARLELAETAGRQAEAGRRDQAPEGGDRQGTDRQADAAGNARTHPPPARRGPVRQEGLRRGPGAVRRGRRQREVAAPRAGAVPLRRVPAGAGKERGGEEQARDLPRQRRVPQHRRRERPRGACGSGTRYLALKQWDAGRAGVRDGHQPLRQQQRLGRRRALRHWHRRCRTRARYDDAVNAYAASDADDAGRPRRPRTLADRRVPREAEQVGRRGQGVPGGVLRLTTSPS